MPLYLQASLFIMLFFGAGFFAGVETGFVSWNPVKIHYLAARGDRLARWAQALIDHNDRVLSAVLIGTNICIVGAELVFINLYEYTAHHVFRMLYYIPETLLLSFACVILCEMIPKSLYRMYSFRLTYRSVPALSAFYFLTLPLTWVFGFVGALLKPRRAEMVSFATKAREEMVLLAMEGSQRGTLFENANVYIRNILTFTEMKIRDLLVSPEQYRDAIPACLASMTVAEASPRIRHWEDDQILAIGSDGIHVLGVVDTASILEADTACRIGDLARPLPRISPDECLLTLLQEQNRHRFYAVTGSKKPISGIIDKDLIFKRLFSDVGGMPVQA